MAENEYEVIGPHKVMGHATGERFTAVWVHPALLGVHVRRVSKPQPVRCPHCSVHGATKKAKEQKFKDVVELRDHYQTEHPGLAAPTE